MLTFLIILTNLAVVTAGLVILWECSTPLTRPKVDSWMNPFNSAYLCYYFVIILSKVYVFTLQAYIYVCVWVCICVRVRVHACACECACECACVCICVCFMLMDRNNLKFSLLQSLRYHIWDNYTNTNIQQSKWKCSALFQYRPVMLMTGRLCWSVPYIDRVPLQYAEMTSRNGSK